MSVRLVVSARGLWKKKQSSFASANGLCFFYLPNFFPAQVRRRAQLVRLFGFQERSLSKFWSKGKVHEPSSSGFFVGSVACGKKTRAASQGSTSFSPCLRAQSRSAQPECIRSRGHALWPRHHLVRLGFNFRQQKDKGQIAIRTKNCCKDDSNPIRRDK